MEALVFSVTSLILCVAIIAYIAYGIGYTKAVLRHQKELKDLLKMASELKLNYMPGYTGNYPLTYTTNVNVPPPPKKKPNLHIFRSDKNEEDKSKK